MSFLHDVVVKSQEMQKKLQALRSEVEDLIAAPREDVRDQVLSPLAWMEDLRVALVRAEKSAVRAERSATGQMAGGTPPVGPPASEVREVMPNPVARAAASPPCPKCEMVRAARHGIMCAECGVRGQGVGADAPERIQAVHALQAEPEAQRPVGGSARLVNGKVVVDFDSKTTTHLDTSVKP